MQKASGVTLVEAYKPKRSTKPVPVGTKTDVVSVDSVKRKESVVAVPEEENYSPSVKALLAEQDKVRESTERIDMRAKPEVRHLPGVPPKRGSTGASPEITYDGIVNKAQFDEALEKSLIAAGVSPRVVPISVPEQRSTPIALARVTAPETSQKPPQKIQSKEETSHSSFDLSCMATALRAVGKRTPSIWRKTVEGATAEQEVTLKTLVLAKIADSVTTEVESLNGLFEIIDNYRELRVLDATDAQYMCFFYGQGGAGRVAQWIKGEITNAEAYSR